MRGAGLLVCDSAVLHLQRQWRDAVVASCRIAAVEVDAHCVVPARIASVKKRIWGVSPAAQT